MFAKRLLEKAIHNSQQNVPRGILETKDIDFQVYVHYGIPSTASVLSVDPIQQLLAIGTLDGRIKLIGGDGIEGLLISPKQLPFKHLEFIQNQGFLVSVSNDNYIQVWDLEKRSSVCFMQWESNITAFSVIGGSGFIYVGDECGLVSVLKYDSEGGNFLNLPYHIPASSISEAAGLSSLGHQPIVGVLHQPCSSGNRLLIAYENGLLILWDVSEARILFIGGGKDLQLKDGNIDPANQNQIENNTSEQYLGEKEISALCWASLDGSVLAVGYVDGDILFLDTSCAPSSKDIPANSPSGNVVRLQLSSAERRLPVVVLQWSSIKKSRNNSNGLLFIYGGDQVGSEEHLTVLNLEWSSGALRCIGRVDIALADSFADMILLPSSGTTGNNPNLGIFVLTNTGKLCMYDNGCLSRLMCQEEIKQCIPSLEYTAVIPTLYPIMTVAKLVQLSNGGCTSKVLWETFPDPASTEHGSTKWPLTGGVPSQFSTTKENGIERLYLSGYQDGSLRIWDATYPMLSSICLLQGKVPGIQTTDASAPVSSVDFCVITLSLAVGNDHGLIYVYSLKRSVDNSSFSLVTSSKHEVQSLPPGKAPHCKAVLSLHNSPVQALVFSDHGTKLAVGFQCGQVNVLDMSSLSVVFCSDSSSGFTSPVISMSWKSYSNIQPFRKSPKPLENKVQVTVGDEVLFILTKDAQVFLVDGSTSNIGTSHSLHLKKKLRPISMYVIEDNPSALSKQLPEDASAKEPMLERTHGANPLPKAEQLASSEHAHSEDRFLDTHVLICFEDSLRLYSIKSVIQGNDKAIIKVKHAKPCCWTSTFEKDGKACGLVLLYQTGDIEIRSLPDLHLVSESSLMSILRWNFKAKIEATMSSDGEHIAMVSGGEWAFISMTAGQANSRMVEALPCLHDNVLAAAADAALNHSSSPKKKQASVPGIFEGIVLGIKGGKGLPSSSKLSPTHLDSIFSKSPFSDPSQNGRVNQDIDDQVVMLDIDDIEIDDLVPMTSAPSHKLEDRNNVKLSDREKLLGSSTDGSEPRVRTLEEIKAKYRKAEDASSVAADARNKLLERQEKLERISRRTAELQSGAEDFASLANELVKTMENRNKKWWHI